jgi:DNA-directed RNA polymerase specialized sigma24 family protein
MSALQQSSVFGIIAQERSNPWFNDTIYREVYEQNRHRIYALAICLTDDELAAEELMTNVFCRVFSKREAPTPEEIDCGLISEVRQFVSLGELSLNCKPEMQHHVLRRNVLRIDVERAVVQLPFTERLIFLMHDVENYHHARIARTLGITEDESCRGLHQARLRMRELLMN